MKSSKYLLVFIGLFLLFIVGCSDATNNQTPENVNNNKSSQVAAPLLSGNLVIENEAYEMAAGGYSFEMELSKTEAKSVTTDAASPNQIAEEIDAISIAPDTVINVKIDQNPEVTLYQWEGSERGNAMDISENMFHSPTEPGKYVYEAFAEWDNLNNTHGWTSGEMSYTFVIEVK